MDNVLTGAAPEMLQIMQLFGMPPHVKKFVITAEENQPVVCAVTYYPGTPEAMGGTVTQVFNLVAV